MTQERSNTFDMETKYRKIEFVYLMFRLNYCNDVKMKREIRVDRRISIDGKTAALSCEILA